VIVVMTIIFGLSHLQRRRGGWPEQLTSGSARGFNVLLITLDTTRADRLGCYGSAEAATPVLDHLAAGGIRFDDAVTVAPITLPSHTTILTGLNPPNHGVRHNGEFHLTGDHETLAETLGEEGYETAAFVSAFVLDARFGLDQGFDRYDDQVAVAASTTAATFTKPIYERSATRVTDAAIQWLSSPSRRSPFFCWVHYFDPHSPYQPPPPYAARFPDRPYAGEIAYMDAQIGRLLTAFETQGRLSETLTIVVADHGESLGEHGESTHAKLIYESTMRVPLIVSCPALIHQSCVVDDVVVSIADIFPTVLELLDINPPRVVDGQSLLAARTNRDRTLYQETLAPYLDNGWSPLFGLRRHKDKYILAPRAEYYDLGVDPGERVNLYAEVSGAALTVRDELVEGLSVILAESPSLVEVVESAEPLDIEAIRRLESLGYVGSISQTDGREELLDPKDVMALQREIDRASELARSGRYDEALRLMKQAAAVSPRDPVLLLTMGKTYLYMDRIAEAEDTFRTILSIRPSARVCILVAQIMLADGRLDEAAAMLDQAESLDPHHGGIYLARGDLFAMRRLPNEAIMSYEKARSTDPYRASAEAQSRIDRLHDFMRKVSPP
jgi:arylsulfatase A-like enzyme